MNPPFLDQPPFQVSTPPFLEKFSKPPFSQFWETLPPPPLGRGVPVMCRNMYLKMENEFFCVED